ncbi:MAG: transcriptional regulator [Gemmatimonadota bacterium]
MIIKHPAPADDALDRAFSALAHPTRRAILTRLATRGAASVTDLAAPFDVSLMQVSKHVRVLEAAGLVRREKDGRVQRCTWEPAGMEAPLDWIEAHRLFWKSRLDALAEYLEREPGPTTPTDGEVGP